MLRRGWWWAALAVLTAARTSWGAASHPVVSEFRTRGLVGAGDEFVEIYNPTNVAPADRDGDKSADARDACPDVAGEPSNDPKKNGCPALARLVGDEIRIAEQVHFETGKSRILPSSDALLEASRPSCASTPTSRS